MRGMLIIPLIDICMVISYDWGLSSSILRVVVNTVCDVRSFYSSMFMCAHRKYKNCLKSECHLWLKLQSTHVHAYHIAKELN